LIYFESKNLFLKESFFESFISLTLILFFNITAAEKTGPAKHPLPTSSTPAILLILFSILYF